MDFIDIRQIKKSYQDIGIDEKIIDDWYYNKQNYYIKNSLNKSFIYNDELLGNNNLS